jgi:hypothetical protein
VSGGRDVHHGSGSVSRTRRHGASCRPRSTSSPSAPYGASTSCSPAGARPRDGSRIRRDAPPGRSRRHALLDRRPFPPIPQIPERRRAGRAARCREVRRCHARVTAPLRRESCRLGRPPTRSPGGVGNRLRELRMKALAPRGQIRTSRPRATSRGGLRRLRPAPRRTSLERGRRSQRL